MHIPHFAAFVVVMCVLAPVVDVAPGGGGGDCAAAARCKILPPHRFSYGLTSSYCDFSMRPRVCVIRT